MSEPNPPDDESGAAEPADELPELDELPGLEELPGLDELPELDDLGDLVDGAGGADAADDEPGQTGVTEAYSQAYSAPESEQFLSAPYVPVDPRLYEYDDFHGDDEEETAVPRWPWVVGVTVIVAAVALVVSVALLVARTESHESAGPVTSTTLALPPVQDEISTRTTATTTTSTPPPSTTTTEEAPPPPPPSSTTTTEAAPPPVEETPEPSSTTTTTTVTQTRPLQVTYTVTGTKAPFDQITITYVDAAGQRRTQRNAYIPWSLTLTPISQSEIGSVEASSMLRLSKLNCSITSSDGRVLSSNSNDAPATSC